MREFKFSLFTPCFNGAHCIHRVFDSIEAQTYKNFEWIIVNDGSTDNSDEVIRSLLTELSSDIVVKYIINDKNLGKHRSWNKALKLATGDLWICCDCDDSFSPISLETFNRKWNDICHDDTFAGINCLCKDPLSGNIRGRKFPQDNFVSDKLKLATSDNIPGEKWDCTRVDLLRRRPFPDVDGTHFTEVYIWWTLALWGYKLLCINEPLRDYFYEPNSIMNNKIIDLRRIRQRHLAAKWYLGGECKWYLWRRKTSFQIREFGMYLFTTLYLAIYFLTGKEFVFKKNTNPKSI